MLKTYFQNISKHRLLVILFTTFILFNSTFIFIYFPYVFKEQAIRSQIDRAQTIADMASVNIGSALYFEDEKSINETLQSFKRTKNVINIILFDSLNNPVSHVKKNMDETCCLRYDNHSESRFCDDGSMYTAISPVIFNRIHLGNLSVCLSLNEVYSKVEQSERTILIISLIMLTVGFLAVFGISRIFVNPLNKLVDTFSDITKGNLSSRAELTSEDEFGKLAQSFNTMVDKLELAMSEVNHSREKLINALDKEKELNELKNRFISMISHEYRTPLTVIYTSSEILSKAFYNPDSNTIRKNIERIQISVDFMTKMLEDVLAIGKGETENIIVHNSEFDIILLVRDIIEDLKQVYRRNNDFVITFPYDTLLIKSDDKIVRQIISNIISNSIKYSKYNSTIELNFKITGSDLTFIVSDKGMGISESDKKHLFTTFIRGKNTANIQGSGLGLSIVKRYIDLIGGDIHIDSDLGVGTTVKLNFKNIIVN